MSALNNLSYQIKSFTEYVECKVPKGGHLCAIFPETGKTGENSSYWKSLKWFSIPASVGFAYIAYLQFRHIQERERRNMAQGAPQALVLEEWQVTIVNFFSKQFTGCFL